MDRAGPKAAAHEIAMIKALVPRVQTTVCDRAMQTFGAMGLSADTPLAMLWTWGRVLRLADGPDEVHLRSVAKQEMQRAGERRGALDAYLVERDWVRDAGAAEPCAAEQDREGLRPQRRRIRKGRGLVDPIRLDPALDGLR